MVCRLQSSRVMVPRSRRKLSLNRATVRSLTTAAMTGVGGGIIKTDLRGACSYSFVNINTVCNTGSAVSDGCFTGVYC